MSFLFVCPDLEHAVINFIEEIKGDENHQPVLWSDLNNFVSMWLLILVILG